MNLYIIIINDDQAQRYMTFEIFVLHVFKKKKYSFSMYLF